MNGIPNPVFIPEKNTKPTFYLVRFLDALFPIYNQNNGGGRNTPSLLSTNFFPKW